MKKLADMVITGLAAAPLTSSGALTGALINATGATRARFVFSLGAPLSGASFNGSIFQAATSGATFAAATSASLAQVTAGAGSGVAVIDMAVDSSHPWLQVSAAAANSNWPASVTYDLYQEVKHVLDTAPQQIVTI
jgi:hypothetical protein